MSRVPLSPLVVQRAQQSVGLPGCRGYINILYRRAVRQHSKLRQLAKQGDYISIIENRP